jgi:hypothetical protein
MKKIASIFLTLVLMLSLSVSAFALTITYDQETIPCMDFLDFADDNMFWATPDAEGAYPSLNPTENSKPSSAVLSNEYDTYLERLEWSLTDDNEVLHLVSNSSSSCGIAFKLGEFRHNINIGSESAGAAEYVKIRIRNTSAATKLSFAWTRNGLSGWVRGISTIDIAPNMTGWYELVINMRNLNIDTNTASNRDGSFWGAQIKDFMIFPFGYAGYGSAYEGYEGASMDIDYVVIGSYDYVTNYQSDLQIKEGNATSFEPVTLPEKTTYYIGETLDLTGFKGKIDYKDGTTEYVDKAAAIFNFDEPAEKTQVTLKYGAHEFSYDVKVVGVENIEVNTQPTESTFNRIDILQNGFKPEGLTIKVNYADGTSQIKELREFKLENTTFDSAGNYVVDINFYGSKATFNIKVIDVEKLDITLIEPKVYYGQTLSVDTSFDIFCVFTDGSKVMLQESGLLDYFSVECDTAIPGGKTTAYAKLYNSAYNIDISTEVSVKVETPVAIKVTKAPALKIVNVDSTFDPSTMNVSYVYSDSTTAVINSDDPDLIVNYDFSVPGVATNLKIKAAKGLTTTYEIKVRDAAFNVEPANYEGTVKLLSAKFPTFWLVFIIVASVIVLLVAAFCVLKFVFKVNFKSNRKRVSLDDIF